MNERLIELYKQAHLPDTKIDPSNNMPYESKSFSAEKFAELIVQKCLSIVEKNHEKAMNEYDTDVDYAMCSTRVDIENQFGVK